MYTIVKSAAQDMPAVHHCKAAGAHPAGTAALGDGHRDVADDGGLADPQQRRVCAQVAGGHVDGADAQQRLLVDRLQRGPVMRCSNESGSRFMRCSQQS